MDRRKQTSSAKLSTQDRDRDRGWSAHPEGVCVCVCVSFAVHYSQLLMLSHTFLPLFPVKLINQKCTRLHNITGRSLVFGRTKVTVPQKSETSRQNVIASSLARDRHFGSISLKIRLGDPWPDLPGPPVVCGPPVENPQKHFPPDEIFDNIEREAKNIPFPHTL